MANKEKLTKRKKINKLTEIILLSSIIIILFGLFLIFSTKKLTSSSPRKIARKMVYPKQYSDNHITLNAKIKDEKFKNITFSNNTSLLGNVVSSLKENDSIPKQYGLESGTWVWTPILQITPEYTKKILDDAQKNGVKNIYLSIDSYLDIYIMNESPEKTETLKKFNRIISTFIKEAKNRNVTIDAEAGWRNWAESGHSYKAFAVLNYAIEFNKNHDTKFRSFQYDIEPYLLDDYKENKKNVLGNFVNLIDESVARLNGSDLTISVVVPEFFDETDENPVKIFYAGKTTYAIEQLLRVLDKREESKIIVMSYRNFSRGSNGTIDISKEEINTANKYKTKIVIAQETGNVEPSFVTFFNTSKKHYEKQTGFVLGAFKNDGSFNGLATHYANSFFDLH